MPSRRTRDPQDVDIGWKLGPHLLELPLLASAMDGVVSPQIATELGKLGGLGVLNLEGIFTRYERPELPADVDVLRVASPPARDYCDVVEPIGVPRFLAAADLNVHPKNPP